MEDFQQMHVSSMITSHSGIAF